MENTKGNRLFVLGHARSGTTILGRLFNSADDVLLLGEAHLFESHWNRQFVTNFNAHHQRTKKVKSKGIRLPSQYVGMLPEEILQKLSQHYQWVGEKIAIGPMAGLGSRAASHALDYYQAYHLDAHYVLSFRAPVPSLHSLQRLFPRLALAYLLQGWMLSFIEIGAASNILKHVCLAPLELMSMPYWERIQQKIGVAARADASWIDPAAGRGVADAVQAALAQQLALELGWGEEPARQFLERLSRLYADFIELIDPQTLYYRPSVLFADRVAQQLLGEVQDMCMQLSSPAAAAPLPGSVCGWLKKDALQSDRRVMPLPSERMQRFAGILRDSLFSDARALLLSDEQCAFPMQADGIDVRRDGPWLRLKARPGTGGHKHLTIRLPIEPLAIATARLLLRREPGHSRYLMLQMGDGAGFHKSVFDCQRQEVASIAASGPVKSVFSQIEALPNGDFRIAISGILANGADSYLRLYLCDASGSIDFQDAGAELMINDFVLGYSHQDCGLEEVI